MLASVSPTKAEHWPAGLNDEGTGEHGEIFVYRVVRVDAIAGALGERQEVHSVVFPVDAGMGSVLYDSDDFVSGIAAAGSWAGKAESMADGIAFAEELLTNSWFTTATGGAFMVSCGRKPRPITTCVPTESKYSAVPFTPTAPVRSSD